jgi:hypothetical protein
MEKKGPVERKLSEANLPKYLAPCARPETRRRITTFPPMQFLLILDFLSLLMLANGTPVVAKKLMGTRFGCPLDGGATFSDGRFWFGPSKTVRGIVLSALATTLGAALIGFGWRVGAFVAFGAMAGDLFSS